MASVTLAGYGISYMIDYTSHYREHRPGVTWISESFLDGQVVDVDSEAK
jgi:hypothetical protein